MNMGDDSKLVYDEVGERLTAVAGEAVDYFPFVTDGRDERIAELEAHLQTPVMLLKQKHRSTWRDMPESYWFARLVEEVGELGGSLVGNHEGPTDWELTQIAAICLNWLEMREARP